MNKALILASLGLALLATGCNDHLYSNAAIRAAGRAVEGAANSCEASCQWRRAHPSKIDLIDYMNRELERQRDQWRYRNNRRWGGTPGWGHGRDYGRDWNHGRGIGRRHGLVAAFEPMAKEKAPRVSKEYLELCVQVGRAYGISTSAATKLMEVLNRAAVNDFLGLRALGVTPDSLTDAAKHQGRLAPAELDKVSRGLGVSSQKADQLIQALLR